MPIIRSGLPTNEQYEEYLNSVEWKNKRRAVLDRCNGICERCGKFRVDEVHHLTYERIFNEMLEDLQGLCAPCHHFLHGSSGVDPLEPAISVTVSWRRIEYWDSEARRFRRISLAMFGRTSISQHELGQFRVPMKEFFDGEGNPDFVPARWEKYRTASRHANTWCNYGPQGRLPADPIMAELESPDRKERELQQVRRLVDHPEQFRSYKGKVPKTAKEVQGLFKRYPRIIDNGTEWRILGVRKTLTMGMVLDLERERTHGLVRTKVYHADSKLAEGAILLDCERSVWVTPGLCQTASGNPPHPFRSPA